MEPTWQQVDGLSAFEASYSCAGDALSINLKQQCCLDSEIMDALNLQQKHLDDKIASLSALHKRPHQCSYYAQHRR
jgi:hypothetical protein